MQSEISEGAGKRNNFGTVLGKQQKNDFGTCGECAVKSEEGKMSVRDGPSSAMVTSLSVCMRT